MTSTTFTPNLVHRSLISLYHLPMVKQLSEGKRLWLSKKFLCLFTAALRSCAFVNILTMGTPFPCVPEAFQQWERRSHAFPLEMTPVSMSVGHLDHILIVYSLMAHVTWKSPGPMCGWVGRILHPDSCTSVSSWSKLPLLSIWSVAVPLCRPLLPCPSWWHGSLPLHSLGNILQLCIVRSFFTVLYHISYSPSAFVADSCCRD